MILQHLNTNLVILIRFILVLAMVNISEKFYKKICLRKEKFLRLYVLLTIVIWTVFLDGYMKWEESFQGILGVYSVLDDFTFLIPIGAILYGIMREVRFISNDIAANTIRNQCIKESLKYESFRYFLHSNTMNNNDILKISNILSEIFLVLDHYFKEYRNFVKVVFSIRKARKCYIITVQLQPADEVVFDKFGLEKRAEYIKVVTTIWEFLNDMSLKYNGKEDENIFTNTMEITLCIPFV